MALDTKYRPHTYDEIVGQEATIAVSRQFVLTGDGFGQSYVFHGGHGGGKTTLARILARALLCENSDAGNPCDQCSSCKSILASGSSECFFEVDAATNSGKDDIKKITESIGYSTFSGKRRVYLFDEAHQLSKNALDALLKPMEDSVPGSQDKLLICIFCTTEPEKMRKTIFSRCAPAFGLRPVTPDQIADRLAYICDQEGLEYERDALVLIAEVCESHIRDSIKAVEGVSKLGPVSKASVTSYLKLDANDIYLKLLAYLGGDLTKVVALADELLLLVSPSTAYEKLAEASMMVYKLHLGVGNIPSYWDRALAKKVGTHHQQYLVAFCRWLVERPSRPTGSQLLCDLAHLHHGRQGTLAILGAAPVVAQQAAPVAKPAPRELPTATQTPPAESVPPIEGNSPSPHETSTTTVGKVEATTPSAKDGSAYLTSGGTFVDPRAQKKRKSTPDPRSSGALPSELFGHLLQLRVAELNDGKRGPKG
ncbi:ATP-binding protein [Deltaproteobacteria bacterium]|nr:ATP-binding protein [Deltaproteobacteria bacterium]